jgi:hypothetical protein
MYPQPRELLIAMVVLNLRHPARRAERDYAPNRLSDPVHINAFNAEVLARELGLPVIQVALASHCVLVDLARVLTQEKSP